MNAKQINDPKNKNEENVDENTSSDLTTDGIYAYNADGSPMDTSERTYISTELPEEDGEEEGKE